jgi:hypothetical protein
MPNKFTYQVLRDTTTDAVIKITGQFDGASGQESNNVRIAANSLYGALATNGYPVVNAAGFIANTALSYYNIQLTACQYFVNMGTGNPPGAVEVFWAGDVAANNATIFYLNGNGEFGSQQNPAILNNSPKSNGNIGITTYGATQNTAYTIMISLRKDNAYYQRGQFNDPAAFNYGPYSIKP